MNRWIAPLVAILAAVAAFAVPAAAADGDCRLIRGADTADTADDVQVCRQDTWVHRATHPVGNLGEVTGFPSWDTTKPTASYQSGAGGGAFGSSVTDIQLSGDAHHGAHWEGSFTGPVDNMAVSLYFIMPSGTLGSHGLTPYLEIDGIQIWAGGAEVDTMVTQVSDGVAVAQFAFVDVYAAMTAAGLDTAPDAEHDITLTMSPFYFGDDGAYVWDAAEVPSGIVFNMEKPNAFAPVDVF